MSRNISREHAVHCVGDGWNTLVNELYDRLPFNVDVNTIKEKFGGLRIYVSTPVGDVSEDVYNLIEDLERRSYTVCEECGKPASLATDGYWVKTVCEDHLNNRTRVNYTYA